MEKKLRGREDLVGGFIDLEKDSNSGSQKTTTHDFTCSVSEFMSSTARLNSREFTGLCEQIWCVDMCLS